MACHLKRKSLLFSFSFRSIMEHECGTEMKEILRSSSQQGMDGGKSSFLKIFTFSLLISIFLFANVSIRAASVVLSPSSLTPSIHPYLTERREKESFLETGESDYLDDDLSFFPANEVDEFYEEERNDEDKDESEDEEGNTPSFFQRSKSFTWSRRGSRRSQSSGRSRPISTAIMEEAEEATPPKSSSLSPSLPLSSSSLSSASVPRGRLARLSAPVLSQSPSPTPPPSSSPAPSLESESEESRAPPPDEDDSGEGPISENVRSETAILLTLLAGLRDLHNTTRALLGEYRYAGASLHPRRSLQEQSEEVQALEELRKQIEEKQQEILQQEKNIRESMKNLAREMNILSRGPRRPEQLLPESLLGARAAMSHAHGALEDNRLFGEEFCATLASSKSCP